MAQQMMQTANEQIEGNTYETEIGAWCKQNGLNDTVIMALASNDINSLSDFDVLESDKDIKDFVDSLLLASFIMKKKLTKAIQAQLNEIDPEEKQEIIATDPGSNGKNQHALAVYQSKVYGNNQLLMNKKIKEQKDDDFPDLPDGTVSCSFCFYI